MAPVNDHPYRRHSECRTCPLLVPSLTKRSGPTPSLLQRLQRSQTTDATDILLFLRKRLIFTRVMSTASHLGQCPTQVWPPSSRTQTVQFESPSSTQVSKTCCVNKTWTVRLEGLGARRPSNDLAKYRPEVNHLKATKISCSTVQLSSFLSAQVTSSERDG